MVIKLLYCGTCNLRRYFVRGKCEVCKSKLSTEQMGRELIDTFGKVLMAHWPILGCRCACGAEIDPPYDVTHRQHVVQELYKVASPEHFICKARTANIGPHDPQECNWPVCGCDPYADRVIAELQESGKLIAE